VVVRCQNFTFSRLRATQRQCLLLMRALFTKQNAPLARLAAAANIQRGVNARGATPRARVKRVASRRKVSPSASAPAKCTAESESAAATEIYSVGKQMPQGCEATDTRPNCAGVAGAHVE
jgi:hypothetical protein